MPVSGHDTLQVRRSLQVGDLTYDYFSIPEASKSLGDLSRLPFSLKVLLENLLRFEDGRSVTVDHLKAMRAWLDARSSDQEIAYRPARVLMQDFTGVPAVVDLAAMRDAMVALGGDPRKINPLVPVDLVIDHSVQVDAFGIQRRLRAATSSSNTSATPSATPSCAGARRRFDNFRVVPPGTGICHQVNLEYLSQVVWTAQEGNKQVAYPDTLVGTDSHTTMVNGLAVLGWGVGGIEAEAAMLGQPVSMLIPEVVGFKLTGALPEGSTATDLVLTVTQMLRKKGVVGKFVEFFGPGVGKLPLADRATIGNMAPEYGATCGFFPVDEVTLDYLRLTGRAPERVALVEAYAKAQGMWRARRDGRPGVHRHARAGPRHASSPRSPGRSGRRTAWRCKAAKQSFEDGLASLAGDSPKDAKAPVKGMDHDLAHGDVVIAAITSCTNTSNPGVMIAAGLVAQKAAGARA